MPSQPVHPPQTVDSQSHSDQRALESLLEKAGIFSNWLKHTLQQWEPVQYPIADVPIDTVHWNGWKNYFPITPSKNNHHPHLLRHHLQPHQIKAYHWLVSLWENGLHGILADEMGLGKTITTIAFIAHLRQLGVFGNILIICPLSVLENWRLEVTKWTPLPVVTYYGSAAERKELIKHISTAQDWAKPIILTTYQHALKDARALNKLQLRCVIVDEGHRLKNVQGKLLAQLKKIDTDMRVLLTGTPLQNNLAELWSLLNFCLPSIFGSLEEFEGWFESVDDSKVVDRLHRVLLPFMLRRTKLEVCPDLPPKKEFLVYTGMTPLQSRLVKHCQDGTLAEFLEGHGVKQSTNNLAIQERKAANHPLLFGLGTLKDTGKIQVLERLVRRVIQGGHAVLVFAQWVETLNILSDWLDTLEIPFSRLDGTMSATERADEIAKFDAGETHVFLLSTRAGGLGLNLTRADTVVFYDSDFNPQADVQAASRAHRIGQTRPVAVYRLCTKHTIEEDVLRKAIRKRWLEVVVMKGCEERVWTADDLDELVDHAWDGDFVELKLSASEGDEGDEDSEGSDAVKEEILSVDEARGQKRKRPSK